MSTDPTNKKKRRHQASPESKGSTEAQAEIGWPYISDGKYRKCAYPQQVRSAVEAVHRDLHRKRATRGSTDPAPQVVFVVIHEQRPVYSSTEFSIVGTYATMEKANETVLKFFAKHYGDFLDFEDGDPFVKKHPKNLSCDDLNQVAWWIDDKRGTLTLGALDGGDGDVYTVYACRQEVQL